MTFEKNITKIAKNIKLSTFSPQEGETIFITLSPDEFTFDETRAIFKIVENAFPNNRVILKFSNITIEAMQEDDLK